MIISSAVTIVVNGSIVAGVSPARIIAGRVVAPLSPVVVRLASRTAYEPATRTVTIERAGARIVVPIVWVENAVPYVEIGPIVRSLGGSVVFDSATKTLAIVLTPAQAIQTPGPFDVEAPQARPTTVFTPSPPPPTPRSSDFAVPRPRRTAIPVTPSEPIVPSPAPVPTSPRR